LANGIDIVQTIRRIVQETVEANKPSGTYFGKVISVAPIQIQIASDLIITERFIVLGRYITEFSVDLTIEGELWHGIRPNDELLLIREQGGQRYAVIDWLKRVDEDTRPAQIQTGEVIYESPLEIKVNDYFSLKEDDLIICLGLSDKKGFLSFDNPDIKQEINLHDEVEITSYHKLLQGDKVLLCCERSSKKWFVVEYVHQNMQKRT